MKELFRNNINAHSPWWNETDKTILVGLFDRNGTLIKKMNIPPRDYIIVPANTIVRLVT